MKQALLIFLVLGISIVQISIAAETTYQSNNISSDTIENNSTSSRNSYSTNSGDYVSSNEEIKQAIANLSDYANNILPELSREQERKRAEIAERQRELAKKPNVRIGMTTSQVLHHSNWGKPEGINTTINSYGKFKQWVYSGGNYLYFTNGNLTSIQY